MRVELRKVIFKSSGMYRCQVTASVRSRGSYGYHNQGFTMKESINREGSNKFGGIRETQIMLMICKGVNLSAIVHGRFRLPRIVSRFLLPFLDSES